MLAGSTGEPRYWPDTLLKQIEPLWDTRRDPLASRSGILGGIHWRAALAGYWAGSTGEQLWRDTQRRSGGVLGGIHWRAALAEMLGGILSGIHWRAALAGYWVGAWCRSIANADSNIKSTNPFLLGGEKKVLLTDMPGYPHQAHFLCHMGAERKQDQPQQQKSHASAPRPAHALRRFGTQRPGQPRLHPGQVGQSIASLERKAVMVNEWACKKIMRIRPSAKVRSGMKFERIAQCFQVPL